MDRKHELRHLKPQQESGLGKMQVRAHIGITRAGAAQDDAGAVDQEAGARPQQRRQRAAGVHLTAAGRRGALLQPPCGEIIDMVDIVCQRTGAWQASISRPPAAEARTPPVVLW